MKLWIARMNILGAVLLLLLAASPALADQDKLMDKWAAKKRAVTNEVYERLRQEGKLPKDGAVEFKAHTRPDPNEPGSVIIEVDEVKISPKPHSKAPDSNGGAAAQNKTVMVAPIKPFTLRWENMDSSDFITYEELDIPTRQELQGRFEVRRGVLLPAPSTGKQSAWRRNGEKPGEKAPAEP